MLRVQKPVNAVKIMAPQAKKADFDTNQCKYQFIWCPCHNKAVTDTKKEKEEKENENYGML